MLLFLSLRGIVVYQRSSSLKGKVVAKLTGDSVGSNAEEQWDGELVLFFSGGDLEGKHILLLDGGGGCEVCILDNAVVRSTFLFLEGEGWGKVAPPPPPQALLLLMFLGSGGGEASIPR